MKKIFFLLIISSFIFSENDDPYFTGPLLTPSANNLEPKKMNIQPYLYVTDNLGMFDSSWHHISSDKDLSIKEQAFIQFGLLKFLDVTFDISSYYNKKNGKDAFEFGDFSLLFGLQILKDKKDTAIPSIRLTLKESFPTGKYKKLNPNKNGTDSTGSGSFETQLRLAFSKTAYFIKNHPIASRIVFSSSIPSLVKVEEFNTYGGGYNTSGKVRPPFTFSVASAFEFSFTQKFIYAMDLLYSYATANSFNGYNGTNKDGSTANNKTSSAQQFSICPALEYGFTENIGAVAGVWFDFYGKNTQEFISYIFSFTATF